jgi:hypothetical protein
MTDEDALTTKNSPLNALGHSELREIYSRPDPPDSEYLGLHASDAEAWKRWRKYAYSKFWENRLNEDRLISEEELQEWQRYVQLDFLQNVASGIVGDAARRNRVSAAGLRALESTPSLTLYALRQVRARLALLYMGVGVELINQMLDSKASWALHELLERDLTERELELIETAARDNRLSRIERHRLREALRARGRRGSGGSDAG